MNNTQKPTPFQYTTGAHREKKGKNPFLFHATTNPETEGAGREGGMEEERVGHKSYWRFVLHTFGIHLLGIIPFRILGDKAACEAWPTESSKNL
ncbi:hypothetical protein CEXT_381701 [Caerostris extrusa]|uniref:Uncharacterized protein n=1 Tax=Caerostris extrusa TaxID=172846 RepID=A0AAV4WEA0_CAEEX|nr:hypothetical protein CEXT_381701 [Caerostris extrusa]